MIFFDQLRNRTRQHLNSPYWASLRIPTMAKFFGGGEEGREIAEFMLENLYNLMPGELGRKPTAAAKPSSDQPGQGESSLIKVNQGESNRIRTQLRPRGSAGLTRATGGVAIWIPLTLALSLVVPRGAREWGCFPTTGETGPFPQIPPINLSE